MIGVWFKSLGQKYLDLRVATGKGLETRIVERPGLWMSTAELDTMLTDLRAVAEAATGGGELDYGIFSADRSRLVHSIITVVYRREDRRPIAFNALAVMEVELNGKPQEVVHLGLVMVDPDVRSQGLSWVLYGLTCLILFARNQLRPFWISNVTQVPAVIGLVGGNFTGVYPSARPDTRRSFTHLLIARQIMRNHRHVFGVGPEAGFDEDRFVITNAYTGGSDGLKKSFDEAAKHRDDIYNDFCARELDYERGDDILQLGQMDLETASRYLRNSVPRESLRGLLLTGALVGLQGLILPVIHWTAASRQWGVLRPWGR